MLSTINNTGLRFRVRAGGSTTTMASNTGEISTGQWYHVVGTYDGQTMRLYKNGQEIASTAKSGALDDGTGVATAMGNQPSGAGSRPFDGLIDDVRIYARTLTVGEIQSMSGGTISVNVAGNGSVTKTPDQPNYNLGDSVLLTAIPDPGWMFVGWSGALSGSDNPDTVVVTGDETVTATFAPGTYTVTTVVVGGGAITLEPDLPDYAYGDSVVVTAAPDSGWTFAGWSGGLSGNETPDTLVVAGDTTLRATFVQGSETYTISTAVVGSGAITLDPAQPGYA